MRTLLPCCVVLGADVSVLQKQKDARADGRSAIKQGDKRAKVKEPSIGDIQTKTYVNLSAEKCQLARGARKTEKATQGVVMGESASTVWPYTSYSPL